MCDFRRPNTVASHEVTLPLYPTMDEKAFETVIQAIQKAL